MRSVCGCMSASSAATEIMNTPRSESTAAVMVVVRRRCWLMSGHARLRLAQHALARVAVQHAGEVVHDLRLLARQLLRHVDHEAVVDVGASAAVELRRALAAQPLDRAMLGPRPDAQRLGPLPGLHLD